MLTSVKMQGVLLKMNRKGSFNLSRGNKLTLSNLKSFFVFSNLHPESTGWNFLSLLKY